MNIKLSIRNGFTLCGLIVGCSLLVVGVVVVCSLVRCIKDLQAHPRRIDGLDEKYPGYQTNSAAPWPEQFTPITWYNVPPPEGEVYESIKIDCGFYVNRSLDMKHWEPVLLWLDDSSTSLASPSPYWNVPEIHGFESITIDEVTYQMKQDFSGIDIQPSAAFYATNKACFWGVSPWD